MAEYTRRKKENKDRFESQTVTFRDILVNAIRMQAMYSNGKIKYTESSIVRN